MHSFVSSIAVCLGLAIPVLSATKNTTEYTVLEHPETGTTLKYVNPGICETTPGVKQYAGYVTTGPNMHMWFWFFEARQNAENAPLVAWLNGGPGESSMIGLFQENGPCKFNADDTNPTNNTYSWTNYANMLYIDQPMNVGFSRGDDTVTSTVTAAPLVWNMIQAFFAAFPMYASRDFGLFTESYGGHYGPAFAEYIQDQNFKGAGTRINLVALGISNGWFDSSIQEWAKYEYAYSNPYRSLIDIGQYMQYDLVYKFFCRPAIESCYLSDGDTTCRDAFITCNNLLDDPIIASADFSLHDIRSRKDGPKPLENYLQYLNRTDVLNALHTEGQYVDFSQQTAGEFVWTGDFTRTFIPTLSRVVRTGITTLIWVGDADWLCNARGVQNVAEHIDFAHTLEFILTKMVPYTVNGMQKGVYKSVENLAFLNVFQAGHRVPYYQPETALQAFIQTMKNGGISPT